MVATREMNGKGVLKRVLGADLMIVAMASTRDHMKCSESKAYALFPVDVLLHLLICHPSGVTEMRLIPQVEGLLGGSTLLFLESLLWGSSGPSCDHNIAC